MCQEERISGFSIKLKQKQIVENKNNKVSKLTKKFATVSVAFATLVSLAGGMSIMPVAGADTISDLQAQIAALTAQLAALSGGSSTTTCYVWNGSLTIGSTGSDVTTLQNYLTSTGHFTFSGGATGYFGSITQAAVAAWQAANGVAPAAGYWGPISQAKYTSMCGTTTGGGTGTGTGGTGLSGGDGSIDSYSLISGLSNEEVGEDDEVEVAGLEISVEDGSDLDFTALRLVFDEGTADQDFEDYADEVAVFLDGEEVGRKDASAFNEDNEWTSTISLDDAVAEAGSTVELTVAVLADGNIDTNDVGETWDVDFTSVRFKDANGASVSEDPTVAVTLFSFESFGTAADTLFKVTQGEDKETVNDAHLINVHATDNTDNAPILSFNVEIEGTSDVDLDSLPINFDVTGNDNVDDMVAGISLLVDGDEVDNVDMTNDCIEEQTANSNCTTVGADETYFFDDLGLTLEGGTDYEFLVKVDLYGITDTGDLALGDTLAANFGETQMDLAQFDAEDESGQDLADADETGTVTGSASQMRDVGFDIVLVGTPTAVKTTGNASTGTSDSGLFTITFDVTAWDGDIFVDGTAPDDAGSAAGVGTESDLGVTGTGTLLATITSPTGATDPAGGGVTFQVAEGETERFSITTDVRDGGVDLTDGFHDVSLAELLYALTDVDGDLGYSLNLGDFKTPQIFLDDLE